MELTTKEFDYLNRQVRRANLFKWMSVLGVLVAVSLLPNLILSFSTKSFVIMILILLNARNQLRLHKNAKLLQNFHTSLVGDVK